jgi:hypothetical protein
MTSASVSERLMSARGALARTWGHWLATSPKHVIQKNILMEDKAMQKENNIIGYYVDHKGNGRPVVEKRSERIGVQMPRPDWGIIAARWIIFWLLIGFWGAAILWLVGVVNGF